MATFESAMSIGERLYSAGRWILMRLVKKERLPDRVILEVVPRSSALSIDCMANTVQAYMRVYNFNPVELKLHHCVFRLNHAGFSIKLTPDRHQTIPAFGYEDIYVRDNLTPEQGKSVAQCQQDSNDPNLECNLTFDTRLGSFEKYVALQNIPYQRTNAHGHSQLKLLAKEGQHA